MESAENTRPPESPHAIPARLRTVLFAFGAIAIGAIAIVTFMARDDAVIRDDITDSACLNVPEFDDEGMANLTREEYRRMYECLAPFETIVIVEGLPAPAGGVIHSGGFAFSSSSPGVSAVGAVSVFSAFADDVGQCYLAGNGKPFQTKVTVANITTDVEDQGLVRGVVTVDVGVSGSGDPFIGVVVDDARGGEPETVANYVPSLPNANAEITVDVIQFPGPRVNQHGGMARLSSTFHNNRDFFPFKDVQWEGDPLYNGTVTVLCGG